MPCDGFEGCLGLDIACDGALRGRLSVCQYRSIETWRITSIFNDTSVNNLSHSFGGGGRKGKDARR